jgi:hypothetical protein
MTGCLAHRGHRSGVAGVYNHATYAEQRKAALTAWADYIDRVVGDNIVTLRPAA